MINYEEVKNQNNEIICIKKTENQVESFIPLDSGNSDYQAYLAAQSTP
jgi:hypothetical protein